MFARAWSLWLHILRQGGVWWILVWSFAGTLGLMLLSIMMGAGHAVGWPSVLLTSGGTPALFDPATFRSLLELFGLLMMLEYTALPLFIAGVFGVLDAAESRRPLTAMSFWQYGHALRDRAWGWIAYVWGVGLTVGAVAVGLTTLLGGSGFWVTVLAGVLALPWMLRMLGGLFVDHRRWGDSVARSFHGAHYGGVLLGLLMGGGITALVLVVGLALVQVSGVGLCILVTLTAAWPLLAPAWGLALYQAERHPVEGRASSQRFGGILPHSGELQGGSP